MAVWPDWDIYVITIIQIFQQKVPEYLVTSWAILENINI